MKTGLTEMIEPRFMSVSFPLMRTTVRCSGISHGSSLANSPRETLFRVAYIALRHVRAAVLHV